MWRFSDHIRKRMDERGYDEVEILSIVEHWVPVITISSPIDDSVDLYFGEMNKKYIVVIVDKYTKTFITARPMNRKERKLYKKEFENE
jgi:hypothetical protein